MQPVAAQVRDYGTQRGSAGMTGASARDFANQAQGLGGVVRLYATYAANVFAVGAAFRALTTAMDTTNMIQGLQQIGAVSGVSLAGLSKGLVAATGGAISLREAMSATVKVTQAGLGQDNVLRLGQVATKASRALGVDMTDAVSRLSRGITKLEPELLDELGIFTKIDPAVAQYSLRVGKAASQLTDFERRQAFANAVLEEGEKKFAAIDIDANPYNKLAASLANIAQQGLELVNKVLGPIINLLSSSPTALIAALVGVAGAIVKQAAPAFGAFRENIKQANQEANEAARKRAANAISIQQDLNKKLLSLVESRAVKESDLLDEAEAKFEAIKARGIGSKKVAKVLETKSTGDITPEQIKTIEEESIRVRKSKQKGAKEEAKIYDDLAMSVRNVQKVEQDYSATKEKSIEVLERSKQSRLTIIGMNERLAESAKKASFKNEIISNAAYNGSLIGPINAIKLMRAELDLADVSLGRFSKGLLIGRASLAAFAGAAATIGTVLLGAFSVITTIVGVLAVLSSVFTKTAKESQATGEAIGQLEDRNKTLIGTIERLNKLPALEQFKPENIQASATAIAGLGDNISKAVETSFKELAKMGTLDTVINLGKMLWNGDVESKLKTNIADGVTNVLKSLEGTAFGSDLSTVLQGILKVDEKTLADVALLQKALDKLDPKDKQQKLLLVAKAIQETGNASAISAAKTTELAAAFKETDDAYKKFANEFAKTDSFSNFGQQLINDFFKLNAALDDPEKKLAGIVLLADNIAKTGVESGLVLGMQELKIAAEKAQVATKEIIDLQKQLADAEKKVAAERQKAPAPTIQGLVPREDIYGQIVPDGSSKKVKELEDAVISLRAQTDKKISIKTELTTEIERQDNLLNTARLEVFKQGANIISSKLSAEWQKANSTIANAYASILSGTETGIKMRAEAEKAMLAAQANEINARRKQILTVEENTIELGKLNLRLEKDRLTEGASPEVIKAIQAREVELNARAKALTEISGNRSGSAYRSLAGQQTLTNGVSAASLDLARQLDESAAALNNIRAQAKAVDLTAIDTSIKLQFAERVKDLDTQQKSLSIKKQGLLVSKDIFTETNLAAIEARQSLEAEEAALANRKDKLAIDVQIASFQKVAASVSGKARTEVQEEIAKLEKRKGDVESLFLASQINKQLADRLETITASAKIARQQQEDTNQNETFNLNIQNQILDATQQQLEFKKNLGALTEQDYIQQKAALDLNTAALNRNKEITAARQAQTLALQEQETIENRIATAKSSRVAAAVQGNGSIEDAQTTTLEAAALAQVATERTRINQGYERTVTLANAVYQTSAQNIAQQQQVALYQDQWNQSLEKTQVIAESLAEIFKGVGTTFENVGTALGGALVQFQELSKAQSDYNLKITEQKKQYNESLEVARQLEEVGASEDAAKARSEANKSLQQANKLQKESTINELQGNAKIIGSVKTMFKEKTGAYRVLSGLEKAMHIASLAMNAQKMISDGMAMVSSVAKSMAGASAAGTEAVAEAYAAPWPIGFASGAAMAVIIGGLLGKAMGGGRSSTGPTAADRQEVQGSAMGYDAQGQQSQFTRGKLGDPTAKSTLLEDTMSLLTQSSVDNLDVNNKQLEALRKIEAGIRGVVAGIYNIPGLASGSRFGTQQGSSGSSFLGLFGSSKTREIVDSGLQFSGNLQELATSSGSLVSAFETVRTSSTRSILGFSRSKVSDSTEVEALGDSRLADFLNKTFDGAIDFLTETASDAGYGAEIAEALTRDLPEQLRTFSARGLKPEEMGQAFQAWLGSVIDYYGVQVFKDKFNEFAQGGEEITQTVARVIQQNKILDQSFKNLGFEDLTSRVRALPENLNKTSTDITVAVGRISQQMIDLAGGLDAFAERENLIASKFLTAGQRTEIARNKLTEEIGKLGGLRDLGIDTTAVKTRQDYVKVIDQLNDAVVRGVPGADKLQNSWKNLAGLFDQTLPEFDNSIDELVTTLSNSKDKIADIAKEIEKLQRPGYDAGNAFWQLSDSLATMYQQLVDADKVTRENVEALIALTEAQVNLLTVQNERKAQEMLTALETEIATKGLKGFAQTVANIAKRMEEFTRNLVTMNQATDANIARTREAARALYDTAAAEAARSADVILLGLSTQTASLGLSQFSREIQGITNTFVNAAQQLADLGQLTQGAIAELMSGATRQIEFAQQQNQQQATTILSSFAQETANQGLTQFAQQIQGIRDKARGAIQQLAQLGEATEENIANIISLAQSQADFVAAQNSRQAQELIIAKNTELITKNLGAFGQELLGIAQQAQDTVKQLVDLGQATDENIAAVRRWQDTMVESARLARLSAQEQQYADLFAGSAVSGVAAKFRSLGFTLPGTVDQFKQLIDAIDTTSVAGIDLRGKLLDLGSEFTSLIEQTSSALRAAYDDRVGELSSAKEQFEGFAESLREFKKSLLTGSLTPLTPQQQYEVNRQEFLQVSARAQGGDVKAIQQLQSASSSFLESSRTMFASSEAYSQDFGLVTSALDNTTTIAEMQVEIANNTLAEIKNVVGALIDLSDITENGDVILTGVGAKLEKTIADYTQLTNNTNIDLSRFEATSANQRNALLEASLFVEDQIRGGINQVAGLIDLGTNIALGNVAQGIVNMSTDVSETITDLQTELTRIADDQVVPGFDQIDQAITTALTDPENPTAAALRALAVQYEQVAEAARVADYWRARDQFLQAEARQLSTDNILRNIEANTRPQAVAAAAAAPAAPVPQVIYYYDPSGSGGGADGTASAGGNFGFAKGANYVPQDMMALIHAGERIIPAADNKRLMNFLDQTATDGSLTQQIEKLQKTILQLEQTVAQGSVINAEATNRNTEVIAETISDTQRERQYLRKIQDRNAIV
jgi:hypothetical protein